MWRNPWWVLGWLLVAILVLALLTGVIDPT
jgi:hypothetical protein